MLWVAMKLAKHCYIWERTVIIISRLKWSSRWNSCHYWQWWLQAKTLVQSYLNSPTTVLMRIQISLLISEDLGFEGISVWFCLFSVWELTFMGMPIMCFPLVSYMKALCLEQNCVLEKARLSECRACTKFQKLN